MIFIDALEDKSLIEVIDFLACLLLQAYFMVHNNNLERPLFSEIEKE